MKTTFALFFLLITGFQLFSQQTPSMYMAMVPKYAGNPCSITDADTANIHQFMDEMSVFLDSISADLGRRRDAQETFMETNEDQIRENVLTQQGYSKADAQRLKNADKMSEEQKMEIANAMLMEKMNMDINDFKKLAEMDTASQKRWAQGYGTMMMADAMANPQQKEQEQMQLKNQFELVNEQQFAIEKLRAAEWKYFQQFDTLQKEADKAYEIMDDEIDQLRERMENCQNSDCLDAIAESINQKRRDYCYRFTPKYIKIVLEFRAYVQNSFEEYNALDVINNKVVESQIGMENTAFEPGLSSLSLIKTYAEKERDVFQFHYAETVVGVGAEGGSSGQGGE